MAAGKVYIGDTPQLYVETGIDLTNVVLKKLKILSPKGVKLEVDATVESPATDGILTYDCVATDLPTAGIYKVQVYTTFAGGKVYYGETAQFKVYDLWE